MVTRACLCRSFFALRCVDESQGGILVYILLLIIKIVVKLLFKRDSANKESLTVHGTPRHIHVPGA